MLCIPELVRIHLRNKQRSIWDFLAAIAHKNTCAYYSNFVIGVFQLSEISLETSIQSSPPAPNEYTPESTYIEGISQLSYFRARGI